MRYWFFRIVFLGWDRSYFVSCDHYVDIHLADSGCPSPKMWPLLDLKEHGYLSKGSKCTGGQ